MLVEGLWKISAIIVSIFLIIVMPLLHAYETEDRLVRMAVIDEIELFLDDISNKGEIAPDDYTAFHNKLSALGYPFSIDIKHYKKIYVPVYENPLKTDTFKGEIREVEELFSFDDIKAVIFPEEAGVTATKYLMNRGDYIVLTVKSEAITKYQGLRKMLFLTSETPALSFRMAGSIKNEID